jgi:predicted enzyme related to lactoylglutathione lyase
MITGVHAILFSPDAEAVRAFLRDVVGWPSVDAGGDWPIFALPPAELAAHPADGPPRHELYLMCDDIRATIEELEHKGVEFVEPISEERWGLVTAFRLPGGGKLSLYEPRHPSPLTQTPVEDDGGAALP